MAALNHISNKPYRNRLSLFLQLSAPRKSSQPGISSDSYFATTPTTSEMAEPLSPTSTRIGRNPSKVSSPIGAPRSPMQSDLEDSIPPTVNELDVREKARLLKKHRKLSRVFGQVPDLQLPSSSTRSWGGTSTPSHRRSASTHTNDSGASRRRATRKISSHSDLGSVSDNGTQLDEGNSIPPVPSLASNLPKDILEALTELNPSQHRKESSLNILTPPKPLSDDDHALSSPSSPVFNGLPDDVRRNRVAKLRRFLGDHGAPSRTLKTRKSYDSSMVKRLDEAAQDKHLHRSRSLTPYKKELDSNDSAVDFHRQYVQTYERGEYIQDAKTIGPYTSSPNVSHVQQLPMHPETRRMSLISTVSSVCDPDVPLGQGSDVTSPSTASIHSVESLFTDSAMNEKDENFRERRRRVAKLAQFFGVQYQDIAESVPDHLSGIRSQTPMPIQSSVRIEPTLDVRTSTRRFWGFSGENVKEAEVSDVLGKLRELKAS